MIMFSKHVGIKESNEMEMMAILEALRIFSPSFQDKLVAKSDSINAISWASSLWILEARLLSQ